MDADAPQQRSAIILPTGDGVFWLDSKGVLVRVNFAPGFTPVVSAVESLGRHFWDTCPEEGAQMTDRIIWTCRRNPGLVGPFRYRAHWPKGRGGFLREMWGCTVRRHGNIMLAIRTLGTFKLWGGPAWWLTATVLLEVLVTDCV